MHVRQIEAADSDRYGNILARTSHEDRYCRFFHAVDHLDPRETQRFVELGPDLLGYIALDDEGRPLGAAHAALQDGDSAELAIVVANDARRAGVGTALFGRLIAELHERGYRRVVAYALSENLALSRLAKAVGMRSEGMASNVMTWSLPQAQRGAGDVLASAER